MSMEIEMYRYIKRHGLNKRYLYLESHVLNVSFTTARLSTDCNRGVVELALLVNVWFNRK